MTVADPMKAAMIPMWNAANASDSGSESDNVPPWSRSGGGFGSDERGGRTRPWW